jgi:putative ABC transport system permease protein
LKDGSRSTADSRHRRRVRGLLVGSQFAMALILLVGAGLVLRSFTVLLQVDPGFDARNTVSLQVSVRGTQAEEPVRRLAFFDQVIERAVMLPGVEAASAINHVPLNGDDWHFPFAIEGRPLVRPGESPRARFLVVRPGYFGAMRIPLRQGRDLTPEDQASSSRVMIINQFMARHYWPNESPIGRRISVDDPATHPEWFTIVGVAGDVTQGSLAEESSEAMYFPSMAGSGYPWNPKPLVTFLNPVYMTLVLRTTADPAAVVPAVLGIIGSLDRDAAVSQVATMEQVVSQQFAAPRFYLLLLGAFAGVAVTLSAVGVYGVLSYAVARRTHEIGVRLALGSGGREVFRLMVRQGMRLAALGGLVGIIGAWLMAGYLRSLLYGIQPTDVVTFSLATILLAGVALVACAVPARRASRVDPMVALRCE